MNWDEAHLQGDIEAMQQAREEAIVRAALERAAAHIAPHPSIDKSNYTSLGWERDRQACRILTLASDPAEVAAIISAARQLKKAGEQQ